MLERVFIWVAVGINLIFAVSGAGQEEQWLQYHFERDAYRTVGYMGNATPAVVSDKPQDIKLLDFKSDSPLFGRWVTPMVKAGGLWMAFDRTSKLGQYDLLYIDSNGNGSLADETAITPYEQNRNETIFGPVKLLFEGEDGPITYHIQVRFYKDEELTRLYIWPAGWYEGTVTVAGTKKHCLLIDHNVNGTFNDKSLDFDECDRIKIGQKDDNKEPRFVGNFVEVDGVLYRPEIARDGACIKITSAGDVVFGNFRVPQIISEFAAGGENGLFESKPENGLGRLPVGKYRIEHWTIERKDETGNNWKLEGGLFGSAGVFDVGTEKEAELSVGEPAASTLEVSDTGSGYYFRQGIAGQQGERVQLTCNDSRAPAPKLHIKSKDGKYDRTFTFEYG
jgi:hypothetical protein